MEENSNEQLVSSNENHFRSNYYRPKMKARIPNSSDEELDDIAKSPESYSYSYEEEEEEEYKETANSETNVMEQFTPEQLAEIEESSTQQFVYLSTADSVLGSFNVFRHDHSKELLQEDDTLYRLAQENSKKMAKNQITCCTTAVQSEMSSQPFLYFSVIVNRFDSKGETLFTDFVNQCIMDEKTSKLILYNFNCAGVGVCKTTEHLFFTVILAQRTYVGNSDYSGALLKSTLLAQKCIPIINQIRTEEYSLNPFYLSPQLCEYAQAFSQMKPADVTPILIQDKLGTVSEYYVKFSKITRKSITPNIIIQQWMNEMDKFKSILGRFNRVGYGFSSQDGFLQVASIYVRSIHSAIIDFVENVYQPAEIANIVVTIMNQFRDQHSLQAMILNMELSDLAETYSTYLANGRRGPSPQDSPEFQSLINSYKKNSIFSTTVVEMCQAPQALLQKIRTSVEFISVLLNFIDEIGVGIAFDDKYVCYATFIFVSNGEAQPINNIRTRF